MGGFTLVVVASVLGLSSIAVPEQPATPPETETTTFTSKTHGYTLAVPADWSPVDRATLDAVGDQASQLGAVVVYDVGWELDSTVELDLPRVFIQVIEYRAGGITRRPGVRELPLLVEAITGADYDALSERIGVSEFGIIGVDIDEEEMSYSIQLRMFDGFDRTRVSMKGYVGDDAIIQVIVAGRDAKWSSLRPTADLIQESFRFVEPELGVAGVTRDDA